MSWRLVVADGVELEPGALEALQAARAAMPDAAVISARVLTGAGTDDPASAPLPRILDKPAMVAAARHGLLAIRAARPGALLLRDGVAPTLRGTAEALTGAGGYLAPGAVARSSARAAPRRLRTAAELLALVRAPFWTRDERLWLLFALTRRSG